MAVKEQSENRERGKKSWSFSSFGLDDAVVVRERFCTCDAFLLFLEYPVWYALSVNSLSLS